MEFCQNKKQIYSVLEENFTSEEGIEYKGYGIRIDDTDGNAFVISDVTDDSDALAALVEHCNDGELDTIHIYDVVEDFLAL